MTFTGVCNRSSVVITGVVSGSSLVTTLRMNEHYFNVLMNVLATDTQYELSYSLTDYVVSTDTKDKATF